MKALRRIALGVLVFCGLAAGLYAADPTLSVLGVPVHSGTHSCIAGEYGFFSDGTDLFYCLGVTKVNITTGGITAANLGANSVEESEHAAITDAVIACGDLTNATTTYLGPSVLQFRGDYNTGGTPGDFSAAGADCSALDSTTEATADTPVFVNAAIKVTGMYCRAVSAATGTIAFTARSAAADLTPTITCTLAAGESDCRATATSTTNIAANATLAVKAVSSADESTNDAWCKLYVTMP